jgi:predicted unusual protein kinase regulating ubiquinone biosynthesis (AarF/ABC1/UbiB family)
MLCTSKIFTMEWIDGLKVGAVWDRMDHGRSRPMLQLPMVGVFGFKGPRRGQGEQQVIT